MVCGGSFCKSISLLVGFEVVVSDGAVMNQFVKFGFELSSLLLVESWVIVEEM